MKRLRPGGRRRRSRAWKYIGTALVVALAGGFAVFFMSIPAPASTHPRADGIVALTGENTRLVPAIELLEHGGGERLLITGVNPLTTKGDLKRLLKGGLTFDCCVDLDFKAIDTRGNARESAQWASAHRYKNLIVVTADYHMPRSLIEFAAAMPDVQLVPYPVAPDQEALPWPRQVPRRLYEYAKYLVARTRIAVIAVVSRQPAQAAS